MSGKTVPTSAEVIQKANHAVFGKPLITNVFRGHIVEAMIALAVEPEWQWCSADYASWDFENRNGTRLEVKQSAYRQSWVTPVGAKITPGFDIKARTGRWEGGHFVKDPGRAAHIYVFAYHGVTDETSDHRNPAQWIFFVVPTIALPSTERLSLPQTQQLATLVLFSELKETINNIAAQFTG